MDYEGRSTKPTIASQAELTRALRAAIAAGFKVGRVGIDIAAGRISMLAQAPSGETTRDSAAAALEEWMAKRARLA